ncbi:Endoplasmin [Amphibalanus amphitrite]|uniref:Endoplasmin n=1 Tax=Amphibalanus amphitrite TaxID=1232801 RepID=A0A6A4VRL0_AMPAM|nr:Endoplasmin [Amphibalanus amphitrite]
MTLSPIPKLMKTLEPAGKAQGQIFLRELISNASDALDKIRLLSLTDRSALDSTPEMTIRIKADKENKMLHITDTGIGMTKEDLIKNLGTIAKSGTSDFLAKMAETGDVQQLTDMIGQFGVGFYSSFLVSDNVIVTSKNNADKQYIWESDSSSFSIVEDPREDTLPRGTTVSLVLKDEAQDFLELDTLKKIIKKYSQFINFDLYLWESKTEEVEEPLEEDEEKPEKSSEDGEVEVEEDKDDKPKTKKVSKTTWDWVKQNDAKPIWTKKPADVEEAEYEEFYKALTKDSKGPLAKTHFIAEGEVTFKSLLYVPRVAPSDMLRNYGTKTENIRLYCETFPFAERLLKKGYEVLYLTEPIDEYAISSLPEFEGKKFQNTAKEGLTLKEDKDTMEELQKTYEPLTKWLGEDVLSDEVGKVAVSNRLTSTPCALVASQFGWTGNMERIVTSQTHTKADDPSRAYYQNQRKTLEINPRHPLIKEMLRLVEEGSADETTRDMARMLYRTSVLRSGFQLKDTVDFAASIETMMRKTLGVPLDEQPEEEPAAAAAEEPEEVSADDDAASDPSKEEHDEL